MKNYSPESQSTWATMHLLGPALEWWNTFKTKRGIQASELVWEDFVLIFRKRFLSKQFYIEKFEKFSLLHRGTGSVEVYHQKFVQLLKYATEYENNLKKKCS